MKFIQKMIGSVKPHFEEGGKLSKFWVVFDSLETFTFTPGHVTHSGSHIRDGIDLKRTMFTVIVALLPALLFGMWNIGDQHFQYFPAELAPTLIDKVLIGAQKVIPLIMVSYGVGLGIEFTFAGLRNHAINEGFLVSGMLIPLIMPVDVPLWMVAVAVAFAVIIGKEVFGGTGMNIINVALTARAFLFFAYPKQMSGEIWVHNPDGNTGATALGKLAETVGQDIDSDIVSGVVQKFYYGSEFDIVNSLIGTIPGSIGETSAIAILIGAVILISTGIGSWRIMSSFLVGGLVMGLIFNLLGLNAYMLLNPLHQIVLGGFMFGMVFMATDPVTATSTNTGKFIYGFLGGFFSIMIRVFNPAYPEGVMMAILFMNVMAPLIDHYVIQANINRRLKRLKTT
ncbi:MAG: NADH:ubiquinone reductase (Na(+)-transporting) subunit B [Crocinitomicaceae bacterium]|nr:NADH:ubiquinone reductase (Na(+)-transporting) subunit B [Crocinitomicaceae bacterium]